MEQPKHIDMLTPNGAELNLDALYRIAPSCFTETKGADNEIHRVVDFDKLRLLLGDNAVEDIPETYDFTWVGKRAAQQEAAAPINMTLRPCPEESVNWDTTQNLYIEGDNLEVMKLLLNSYMGKIKMIYIDPPYNTGNDFVYHDDFSQSAREYEKSNRDEEGNRYRKNNNSNGRFHSDWCSMIYSRLMVARSLLSKDGVIFISIDDNEVNNLRKICDEVFGESNFVNEITVNMNSLSGVKMTHAIRGKRFPAQKEYILLYKKGIVNPVLHIEKKSKDGWDKEYNMIIPQLNDGQLDMFQNMSDSDVNSSLSEMQIISLSQYAKDNNIKLDDEWKFANSYRIFGTKSNTSLAKKIRTQTFSQQISSYVNSEGNRRYFITQYNKDVKDPRIELVNAKLNMDVFISDNWIDISNDGGVAQEGGVIYPNGKKPLSLISRIINTANDKHGIYLDFFAGSSTTAHAVMQQNLVDKGDRRFIMVQLPEDLDESLKSANGDDADNIKNLIKFLDGIGKPHKITEIGKERIRRSGKKIQDLQNAQNENVGLFEEHEDRPIVDIGFRVFKCESSNYKDVSFAPKDYSQGILDGLIDNIKEDRTDLDLLYDCMLRWGVELSLPLKTIKVDGCTIHNVNNGDLVACFNGNITESVIAAIAALSPVRVVFRDSSFNEAAQKMNLFELFKQKCDWSDEEVRNNVRVI